MLTTRRPVLIIIPVCFIVIHRIRCIPVIVIVVIGIMIVNNNRITMISTMITMVGIIMIMAINTYCHYSKSSKIGWINRIMIRRIIGNVYG